MTDDTLLPFSFPAIRSKKITAAFDGGRITSDGGVMLLAAAERRLQLADRLAAVICDPRDPDRVTQLRDGLVIAAADGCVAEIEKVLPPSELDLKGGERVRIVTHLSPFDVHVNRAPVAGRVSQSVYVPGAFVNPTTDKESEDNERRLTVLTTPDETQCIVVQIAGMISRRIVAFVHEGDSVGAGQRIGLIRFGSRVDVYLPPGATPLVSVGQRVVAGESVLADLKSNEPEREARRT